MYETSVDQQTARTPNRLMADEPHNGAGLPQPIGSPVARTISIQPLNHGFHVTVGCQDFACESVDALLHRLGVYLKAPQETDKNGCPGSGRCNFRQASSPLVRHTAMPVSGTPLAL